MNFHDFWYVACLSRELKPGRPRAVKILESDIVLFRNEHHQPVALEDRCLHRAVQLSLGRLERGHLRCAYHGWLYNGEGEVVGIPAHGPCPARGPQRQARTYKTFERDDLVFVCLAKTPVFSKPFPSPHYKEPGWRTERRINTFANNVTNCVENFVDVPHTVFVHPSIFREPKAQRLKVAVERRAGKVIVSYENETNNFGLFSRFLNPRLEKVLHKDIFYMPNVTSVEYHFGSCNKFFITSQSIPVTDKITKVYTDLTYRFGAWTRFARPFVRALGQKVIDQDVDILANQMRTIEKHGAQFQNSTPDIVHVLIESVRDALGEGRDPRDLPVKTKEFEMWI